MLHARSSTHPAVLRKQLTVILGAFLLALCLPAHSAFAEPNPLAGDVVFGIDYAFSAITVPQGTIASDLGLPDSVGVQVGTEGDAESARQDTAAVFWTGDYDSSTPGVYTLTMAFTDPDLRMSTTVPPWRYSFAVHVDVSDSEPFFGDAPVSSVNFNTMLAYNPQASYCSFANDPSVGIYFEMKPTVTHNYTIHLDTRYGSNISLDQMGSLAYTLYDAHGTVLDSYNGLKETGEGWSFRLEAGLTYYVGVKPLRDEASFANRTLAILACSDETHAFLTDEELAQAYPDIAANRTTVPADCLEAAERYEVCRDCLKTITTYDTSAVGHHYNANDVCTNCGHVRGTDEIAFNEEREVFVKMWTTAATLQFTPEYTHHYLFKARPNDGISGYTIENYVNVWEIVPDGENVRLDYNTQYYDNGYRAYVYLLEGGKTYNISYSRGSYSSYLDSYLIDRLACNMSVSITTPTNSDGTVRDFGVHDYAAGADPVEHIPATDCLHPGSSTYACAICGITKTEKLTAPHAYADGVCTVCGATEALQELSFGETASVKLMPVAGIPTYVKYTPQYTHRYTIGCQQSGGITIAFYDEDWNELSSYVYQSLSWMAGARGELEAGKTYYLAIMPGRDAVNQNATVTIACDTQYPGPHVYEEDFTYTTEPTCQSTGKGYGVCALCGMTQNITFPKLTHVFGPDHKCTECGYLLAWCPRTSWDGTPLEVWLDDGTGNPKLIDRQNYTAFDADITYHNPGDPEGQTWTDHRDDLSELVYSVADEIVHGDYVERERTNLHYVITYMTDEYAPLEFTLEYDRATAMPLITMDEGSKGRAELINVSTFDPETGRTNDPNYDGYPAFDLKFVFEKADAAERPARLETVDTDQYGFTINLFDYSIGTDDTVENTPILRRYYLSPEFPSKGMNAYSPLKFYGGVPTEYHRPAFQDRGTASLDSNCLSEAGVALQGVVLPELGDDGYPVTTEYNSQSLARLFNDASIQNAKAAYLGVNHLFVEKNGLLSFDSASSYAYYDTSAGNGGDFVVYDGTYEVDSHSLSRSVEQAESQLVGFMPFDDYDSLRTSDARTAEGALVGLDVYNRYYGFSMSGEFTLPASMKTAEGDDFVFEFGGDDDAWLFIDGVLVAEAAGMHEGDGVSIDFTTNTITTTPVVAMEPNGRANNASVTVPKTLGTMYTLDDAFAAVGKTWNPTAEHEFVFYRLNRISSTPQFSLTTNLHKADGTSVATMDINVAKEWADGAAAHANETATVQLVADGVDVEGATLALSADNGWKGVFAGQPKYASDGVTEIVYTVREQPKAGWNAVYEQSNELADTRTLWVPVAPSELVDGETYAIVADSDVGPHLLTFGGVNRNVAAGTVIIYHDARTVDGTEYAIYLKSVNENQKWKFKKKSNDWILSNHGQYLTLMGASGTQGPYFYEFHTYNLHGWSQELSCNFSNRMRITDLGNGHATISNVMSWGNDMYSPEEYLRLGTLTYGNVYTATDDSSSTTPVTFYKAVTADIPDESAVSWTITNSNRTGSLAIEVVSAGEGAGQIAPTVTVTLGDNTISGTYGDLEFAGGVASATVANGQTVTVRDLPEGVSYTVAGSAVDGYQLAASPEPGKVAAGEETLRLVYAPGATPVEAVENLIDQLPDPDKVTAGDKDAIEDALKAYDSLTDEEKAQVSQDAKDKLAADEAALDKLLNTPVIERIWGDYANETSAKISAKAFDKSDWVVIARDDDFADALGAVGLAGAKDAPIVLTDRFELSPAAAAEVTRLEAKHAYIIGGTGAIKEQVDADLRALGVDVAPRIWGDASYDTSLACAKEIESVTGESADTAVIAMSLNFQDALSISPYAYKYKVPVVLQTWGDTSADRGFTDEAKAWLEGKSVLVAGGAGAISDASIAPYELVDRLWGESGYDTSNKIAEWMTSKGYLGTDAVVFACGAQLPKGTDALAGAALAGRLSAPILLATSNEAMEPADATTVEGFYAANADKVRHTYVLGGAYVMPDALYARIQAMNSAEDVSD